MRNPKQHSSLWKYIYISGIDITNKALVNEKKKEYYQMYDKEFQKRKRKIECRQFSISFPIHQINHVRKRAKDHGLINVVDYLKALVKADLSNSSPLEQTLLYKEVLQLLQHYKNSLDAIEANESKRLFGNNNYNNLRKILDYIQAEIEIKKK